MLLEPNKFTNCGTFINNFALLMSTESKEPDCINFSN